MKNNSESTFQKELEDLINRHSKENGSNTPDFMLAEYLVNCLEAFNHTVMRRSGWYAGRDSIEWDPERSENTVEAADL